MDKSTYRLRTKLQGAIHSMWRLAFVALVALEFTMAGAEPRDIHRIGVLYLGSSEQSILRGLQDGLRELGFVDGDSLSIDMPPNDTLAELRKTARRFDDMDLNLIVSVGGIETGVAQELIRSVPILFLPAENAVQAGFVESLARPNTNLSGITLTAGGAIEGKRMDLFKELMPSLQRVMLLYDARLLHLNLAAVRRVATKLGIVLEETPIDSLSDATKTVDTLSRAHTDGIFIICSSLFNMLGTMGRIASDKQIAMYSCSTTQVAEQHGLFTYSPDFYFMGYRGALYASRIFRGHRLNSMPVETPRRYELVINLRLANRIGIRVPPEVLMKADKVFR